MRRLAVEIIGSAVVAGLAWLTGRSRGPKPLFPKVFVTTDDENCLYWPLEDIRPKGEPT